MLKWVFALKSTKAKVSCILDHLILVLIDISIYKSFSTWEITKKVLIKMWEPGRSLLINPKAREGHCNFPGMWVQFSKLILHPSKIKSPFFFFLYCQTKLQTNYKIRESRGGVPNQSPYKFPFEAKEAIQWAIALSSLLTKTKEILHLLAKNLISSIMDQTSHGGTSSELLRLMVTYGYTNFNIINCQNKTWLL